MTQLGSDAPLPDQGASRRKFFKFMAVELVGVCRGRGATHRAVTVALRQLRRPGAPARPR